MASPFRLARPLCPQIIRPLRQSLSPRFFTPSQANTFGLNHGPSKFLKPQPSTILRRLYARNHNQGWGPSSPTPPPPPPPRAGSSETKMRIIYLCIAINTAVCAYAFYCKVCAQQGNPKPYMDFAPHALLNFGNVFSRGHYETIITSAFTHQDPFHLLGNMLSLYFIGRLVAYTPSVMPAQFATLIIGSALSGSLGFLFNRYQHIQRTGERDNRSGIGFSGAVMGVGVAASMMHPREVFYIYGLIPMPLWVLMGGYLLYDGYYLGAEKNTRVSHSGHLGGAAFGALYYFLALRRGFLKF